jgi:hypothetical protein
MVSYHISDVFGICDWTIGLFSNLFTFGSCLRLRHKKLNRIKLKERSTHIVQKEWQTSVKGFPNGSDSATITQSVLRNSAHQDLAGRMGKAMRKLPPESKWQKFIQENIPKLLPQYVRCFPLVNLGVGNPKIPDFLLQTHDGYIDVLEIKKPDTPLLKKDRSHGHYCWTENLTMAFSQIAHYLNDTEKQSFALIEYLRREYNADVRITKPKGIILAGDMKTLSPEAKNDFRLLSQFLNGIEFKTYDDLLINLMRP